MLKFSVELSSCLDTLLSIDYLHKIDNFDVLSKIARRLPQSWMTGWQAELDSIVHIRREEASIKHLASYVSLKTRQATNSECNWSQDQRPDRSSAKPFKGRKKTRFSTQITSTPTTRCKLCQGSHYLNQCKRFRKFSVPERLKFVNETRLCRVASKQAILLINVIEKTHAKNRVAKKFTQD